jgi:hypothetical protein
MRLALLCVGAMFVTASAVRAGDLAEAPRKEIEAFFKDKIFKKHVQIEPTKTKFDPEGNELRWTVTVLTDKAVGEILDALEGGEFKTLVFKDASGRELGSIRLDDGGKVGFLRAGSKKGDMVDFVVRLPDGVDAAKVKSVVGGK